MKYIIIILFLLVTSLMGVEKEKQLVPPDVAMKLLDTIRENAIVLGHGKQEVHAFIDPLCMMSQIYLALIYKHNKNIFAKYTIYLYLHEIKSKNSKKFILNIMSAESSERMLRAIMLDKEEYDLKDIEDEESEKNLNKVADVARQIGVYKRPYIMINGQVK